MNAGCIGLSQFVMKFVSFFAENMDRKGPKLTSIALGSEGGLDEGNLRSKGIANCQMEVSFMGVLSQV